MRIAYVVDVHDRFDAVQRAVLEMGEVDVLVVGGDVTTFGTPDDVDRAIELWRPLAPHLLAVAGNCDSPAIDERLVELGVSIDGRGVTLAGVGFAGVSAAPLSPLHTPHEVPDEELGRRGARDSPKSPAATCRSSAPTPLRTGPRATGCARASTWGAPRCARSSNESSRTSSSAGTSTSREERTSWGGHAWSTPVRWPRATMRS